MGKYRTKYKASSVRIIPQLSFLCHNILPEVWQHWWLFIITQISAQAPPGGSGGVQEGAYGGAQGGFGGSAGFGFGMSAGVGGSANAGAGGGGGASFMRSFHGAKCSGGKKGGSKAGTYSMFNFFLVFNKYIILFSGGEESSSDTPTPAATS